MKHKTLLTLIVILFCISALSAFLYFYVYAGGACGCGCRQEGCSCPKDCTCGGAGCPPCKYFCYENPPNCLRTCGAYCGGECPGGGTCKWCVNRGRPQCQGKKKTCLRDGCQGWAGWVSCLCPPWCPNGGRQRCLGKGCKRSCSGRRCDHMSFGCINVCFDSPDQCTGGDCDEDPYAPGPGCCKRAGCDCCYDCKPQGNGQNCIPYVGEKCGIVPCLTCFAQDPIHGDWHQVKQCCGDDDIDFHGCGIGVGGGYGVGCVAR